MTDHTGSPFLLFKGLRPIPFLLPKAPPYSSAKHAQKLASRAAEADQVAQKRGKSPIDVLPTGPRANKKTLSALSGKDASETISRIGRATRHQNKEFQARVHPISGRVEGMVRGDHASVHAPISATKSMKRMAEMSESAKNPAVRERATRNISNQNPNLRGPDRLYVHNHPKSPGGKSKINRAYPSAADTAIKDQVRPAGFNFKGAVVSHKPGPRGAKKTKVVYFGQGPDKLKQGRNKYPIEGGSEQDQFLRHDLATQPKDLGNVSRSDFTGSRHTKRKQAASLRSSARREYKAEGKVDIGDYDGFMRSKSASPAAATKSGLHTRERMMKRLSPFGITH